MYVVNMTYFLPWKKNYSRIVINYLSSFLNQKMREVICFINSQF